MILTEEEKEALRFEFSRLIRQKHQIGAEYQGFKWQSKHEKHLSGVAKMIVEYERQTGDYHYFLRTTTAGKAQALPPQMQLI